MAVSGTVSFIGAGFMSPCNVISCAVVVLFSYLGGLRICQVDGYLHTGPQFKGVEGVRQLGGWPCGECGMLFFEIYCSVQRGRWRFFVLFQHGLGITRLGLL